jgi:hypothetical protein
LTPSELAAVFRSARVLRELHAEFAARLNVSVRGVCSGVRHASVRVCVDVIVLFRRRYN